MMQRALLLVMLAGATSVVSAQAPFDATDPIIGEYQGVITVGGMPQPIWLEITSTTPGTKEAAMIKYSQPRNTLCLHWQYGGASADGHVYYWDMNSSGCELERRKTYAPLLIVRLTENGGLRYELRADKDTVLESHVLKPQ